MTLTKTEGPSFVFDASLDSGIVLLDDGENIGFVEKGKLIKITKNPYPDKKLPFVIFEFMKGNL